MTVNDWLEISQMSGTGNAEVTLTASSYEELVERTATLKVKGVSTDALISIKQNAFIPTISISERTLYASFLGETLTVTILSNANWSIDNSVLPEWITINDASGEANVSKTLDIIVSDNIGDLREVTIPIFMANNPTVILVEIKITQDAYDEETVKNQYFWVKLEEDGEINVYGGRQIQYSYDRENWYSNTSNGSITAPANTYVWLKNKSRVWYNAYEYGDDFVFSTRCSIGGDLSSLGDMREKNFMSLFNGNTNITDASQLILPWDVLEFDCFVGMFGGCTNLVNAPSIIPAKKAGRWSCASMFEGCTSLVNPPVLPATTLEDSCYNSMFKDCTSLTTAPELPATTLAGQCYLSMFRDCASLTTAPELPATTLAGHCYGEMFWGCTSLTTAPELPVTELVDYCYANMFKGCTSLVNPPVLPATTLANNCYDQMFKDCTSLTTAPTLPAPTLTSYCYYGMFWGCTSLTTAPELPATTLAGNCYLSMFRDCASLTTAPELPATTLAEDCYGAMFEGCTSLTTAPELPATTLVYECYGSMFRYCSNLNYIKMLATQGAYAALWDWVEGVAPTGTFVKHPDMNDLTIGVNGIPEEWTVIDATE